MAALFCVLIPSGAGAAPLDPRRLMPANAGFVAVWKDPAATFRRLESLAVRAGSAPPRAEPGWLSAALVARNPAASDIDWSRPVWLASMPEPDEDAAEPQLIAVVGVKGKAEKLTASLAETMHVTRLGAWLVAVDQRLPETMTRPGPKWFRFPEHAATLRGRSDVAAYLRLSAYPALLETLKSEDETALSGVPVELQPIVAAFRATSARHWEETAGYGLGIGLAGQGLELFFQPHPKPGTDLQKQMKKLDNEAGPLAKGLPAEDYLLVAGIAGNAFWSSAIAAMVGAETRAAKQLEKLKAIHERLPPCSNHSFGVTMAGTVESARMVAASQCKSGPAFVAYLRRLFDWTSESIALASAEGAPSGSEPSTRARRVEKSRKVGEVSLDEWTLDLPEEAASAEGSAEGVAAPERPLAFGVAGPRSAVLLYNVPDPVAARAVRASRSAEPLAKPANLSRARAQLLSPRYAEAFLFAGPIVSMMGADALGPAFAAFRVLMAQMPPAALSVQGQPDGSQLVQLFLPEELAQLAAAVAQMQQPGGL